MTGSAGYDLTRFGLGDMSACGSALREAAERSVDAAGAAGAVAQLLHRRLVDGSGRPATALVRFFATQRFGELDEADQAYVGDGAEPGLDDETPCLRLLASTGLDPAWNDPAGSAAHRVLPVSSRTALERTPMLRQLLGQLGMAPDRLRRDREMVLDRGTAAFHVVHVEDAASSPYVPAKDFVERHRISSVLGFGATLPNGELFAVIAFSTVPISDRVARRFEPVALQVKLGLLRHLPEPASVPVDAVRLRTLEELLRVHQQTVAEQGNELEDSNRRIRALASAAVDINEARAVEDILERVTRQARIVIGAHQSVTSLTVDADWSQAITDVELSDRYDRWRDYAEMPDGSGIYRLVVERNQPMRLTQAELEAHPAFLGFGAHASDHPPMRGWLAAPLIARDGSSLGLVQVSDRLDGDFTAEDEAALVQLAQMGALAIENVHLAEAEALREGERFRQDILAGVTHDMKTPVAAVVGLAETLGRGGLGPEDHRAAQEALVRQARTLKRLVLQFLDYARLEAGREIEVAREEVDVAEAIGDAVGLFAHQSAIRTRIPDDLPTVIGDGSRVRQVVANLLSNATKFSPFGSTVEVEVQQEAEQVVVLVHDEGSGVAPGEAHHLFQKFYRGSAAEGQPGSGLGLYLSKLLVEAMGGSISYLGRDGGERTTFAVRLRRQGGAVPSRGSENAEGGA